MAKAAKKATKPRAEEYEKKVAFNGTFEDMIAISVKSAIKNIKAKHDEAEKQTGEGLYRVQVIKGTGFGRVSKLANSSQGKAIISFEQRAKYNDTVFKLWATSADKAKEKVKKLCTDNWELDFDKLE